MNTHTPGPWIVDPRASLRVVASNDATVCSTGCTDTERNSWECNARLIAAAPELLAALAGIMEHGMTQARVDNANRAIEKATKA
jgi:hypothetical protein